MQAPSISMYSELAYYHIGSVSRLQNALKTKRTSTTMEAGECHLLLTLNAEPHCNKTHHFFIFMSFTCTR